MRMIVAVVIAACFAPVRVAQSEQPRELVHPADAAPERQFDFWLGQWDVVNRFIDEDGSERIVEAEAMIWPGLGWQVIVEHWRSKSDAWPMRGFSMRTYDPERDLWTIALCWPGEGPAKNNLMEGRFRNGRGEFYPTGTPDGERPQSRFTFSDVGPNSLRWDLAVPVEGDERAWRTTWVMEWSRRDARHRLDDLHGDGASENTAADWIVGNWFGEMTGTAKSPGHEFDTLEATAILDGRAILLRLFDNDIVAPPPGSTHADPVVPAHEHVAILTWDRDDQLWRLCETRTGEHITLYEGEVRDGAMVLTSTAGDRRMRLQPASDRSVALWSIERQDAESDEWVVEQAYYADYLGRPEQQKR